jgi:hypothetical protein
MKPKPGELLKGYELRVVAAVSRLKEPIEKHYAIRIDY